MVCMEHIMHTIFRFRFLLFHVGKERCETRTGRWDPELDVLIGSGSVSSSFRQRPSRRHPKIVTVPFEGTFTSFFRNKNIKKSQNSRNKGFSCYFSLMT